MAHADELPAARIARWHRRAFGGCRDLRREPRIGAGRQVAVAPGQRLRPDLPAQPPGDAMSDSTIPAEAEARAEHLRLLEALLFAAASPLDEASIAARLPEGADVADLVAELAAHYEPRGVNIVRVAGGWTLRTAPDLAPKLKLEQTVMRKLSRAAIETLAIVAYHQPVTRGEIEEIRGVVVSGG